MNDRTLTSKTMAERIATQVVENVCELPDYNSPEDQPDLVMCTVQELENCVLRAFEAHGNETDELLSIARDLSTMDCFWSASGHHEADCKCLSGRAERAVAAHTQKALEQRCPVKDDIRDLACCDVFTRESASEFCATCGYTNLDHLRKRSSQGKPE